MSLKLNDLKDYHEARESAFLDKKPFPIPPRQEENWGVISLDGKESWKMEDWGFVQKFPEGEYTKEEFPEQEHFRELKTAVSRYNYLALNQLKKKSDILLVDELTEETTDYFMYVVEGIMEKILDPN